MKSSSSEIETSSQVSLIDIIMVAVQFGLEPEVVDFGQEAVTVGVEYGEGAAELR